jgi:hypothetical protein
MVLARARAAFLSGLGFVEAHCFADGLEVEPGVEREELVLGRDHRHGRVRRDCSIHPAISVW